MYAADWKVGIVTLILLFTITIPGLKIKVRKCTEGGGCCAGGAGCPGEVPG